MKKDIKFFAVWTTILVLSALVSAQEKPQEKPKETIESLKADVAYRDQMIAWLQQKMNALQANVQGLNVLSGGLQQACNAQSQLDAIERQKPQPSQPPQQTAVPVKAESKK